LIKGDIGDSCEDLANVVDGEMTLGDNIILTPVDFDASGDFAGAALGLGTLPPPSLAYIDNIDFFRHCAASSNLHNSVCSSKLILVGSRNLTSARFLFSLFLIASLCAVAVVAVELLSTIPFPAPSSTSPLP
jgi:hypothetical protein